MKRIDTFIILLTALFSFSVTQADAKVVSSTCPFTHACWISIDKSRQTPNQWICFRKQFTLNKLSKAARLSIAVDSKYWLWVNGKEVVVEGELKRGPNPHDTYYDIVNLTPYLQKGTNTLAVQLWYWGKQGFCHNSSGTSGLIAALQLDDTKILSDNTWKVKINNAFGETGDPKPNYRLPESNVHYDAQKELGTWTVPTFSDTSWSTATVLGTYPCEPWNKLIARPFPNWRTSDLTDYVNVETRRTTSLHSTNDSSTVVTGQLPRNITVLPYLKINARAGELIDIRSDNYKGGSEYNVRAEYVTKNGEQEFLVPNYVNGHNILYTLPSDIQVLRVGYRETAFNTRHLGSFSCSDPFYNKLWQKALNTMNLNMRDAIQDADRERSQWWGDAAIILNEILYSCDDNGRKLITKAIDNLVDWQKPDGVLFSPIPAGSWDKELPIQMLASIGKYGFWNYYKYTGDIATLRHVYPAVKRYLALYTLGADNLIIHRPGGWDWADWGDNIDVPVVENAWFCLAQEAAENMARTLGDNNYAQHCRALREKVQQAARAKFWAGQYVRSASYKGTTDDRANGMAILADFVTDEQANSVRSFLKDRFGASPYMEKYVVESFFVKNHITEGLARMKTRYTNMVNSPLTTLWEDWQIGGSGGGSINHGWAGGPLPLLSQYVAGIAPMGIDWKQILIRPQLGNLSWVECTVPVHDKTVRLRADNSADKFSIQLDNNTNRLCAVVVPDDAKFIIIEHKELSRAAARKLIKTAILTTGETVRYMPLKAKHTLIEFLKTSTK